MDFWVILQYGWKIGWGYIFGSWINTWIVHGNPGGGLVGLIDDVIILLLKSSVEASFVESVAIGVFAAEVLKIIEDGEEYWSMNAKERATLKREQEQHSPHNVYLYGNISAADALRLWISGRYLAKTELPASVWQAVENLFGIVAEDAEVGLVA